MRHVSYSYKTTQANTQYVELENNDFEYIQVTVLQLTSYMAELSVSRNKSLKEILRWYKTANKHCPYSTLLKSNNSPQSFLAGIINNFQFGTQKDFTEKQILTLEYLINTTIDIIEYTKNEIHISLQKDTIPDKILFQNKIFEFHRE